MSKRRQHLLATAALVLSIAAVVAGAVWFFAELRPVNGGAEQRVTVTVLAGSGVRQISQQLEAAGLLRSRLAFELAVGLAGFSQQLQAGTFELSRSMSASEIARSIAQGAGVKEVVITVREGWTSRQIGEELEKQGLGRMADFVVAASSHDSRTILPDESFDFLAGRSSQATLEGYLFPDTYRFFPEARAVDVIRKMLANFGKKLTPDLRIVVTQQGRTLFDAVTLASIIEREVVSDIDRRKVADIFWRRLDAGIPLQSDATVNYVTGKNLLQPTLADTEVDSPYNTYKYRGLPPGPIGNPGLASITAVIRPEANTDLYFLTDAAGNVHYAKTFEEHLENKRKYLP